jgi:hypothetical protein
MKKKKICILKINEESSRTRSWIRSRIHQSAVRIRGSGSAPKCHGSPTLIYTNKYMYWTIKYPGTTGTCMLVTKSLCVIQVQA